MSQPETPGEMEFAAWIGLDWGDGRHAWVLQEAGHSQRQRGTLDNTPEAVECWAMQLHQRFGGRAVAIAVEQSRGAVVWMLSKYAHVVLYPVHPATSHSFRRAMFPSGSKDDPSDADLLLDLLSRHPERLRALRPDTEPTRKLQALVEKRRQLVDEQTAQSNRLTHLLKTYFPQVLGWVDKIASPIGAALLQRWPTLEQLQKDDDQTIRSFFQQHGCRSEKCIRERLLQIRSAVAATRDAAVIEPGVLMVTVLVGLVAELRHGIAALERAIEQVVAEHPDYPIFASFPAAAKVMGPRLLAAFGSQRQRYGSAGELLSYSGIAPVISRSGSRSWIHFRWACPKFLRQTFHEYAALSIQRCGWAREFYQRQRSRGKDHHAAVRSLAFKWIRILFRCWQSGTLYDEALCLSSRTPPATTPAPEPPAGEAAPPVAAPRSCGQPAGFQFKTVAGLSKFCGMTP